jgi:hypothetical protein
MANPAETKFRCLKGHGVIAVRHPKGGYDIDLNGNCYVEKVTIGMALSTIFALANQIMSQCTGTTVADEVHACIGSEQCHPSCKIWWAYNSAEEAVKQSLPTRP